MSSPDRPADHFADRFMADYYAECDEHLTAIRRILLSVERQPQALTAPKLEELFRSFHSIKGLSGMVEMRDAELVAHHMESYLRALRGRSSSLTRAGLSTLIEATQALEQVIAARRGDDPPPPLGNLIDRLEALPAELNGVALDDSVPSDDPARRPPRWRVVFSPSAELSARGIGVDRVRALLTDAGDIVEASPLVSGDGGIQFAFVIEGLLGGPEVADWGEQGLTVERLPDAQQADVEAPAAGEAPAPGVLAPAHYVRVDLSRLDDLMRMIGDLVIGRARLGEALSHIEPQVSPIDWRAVQEHSLALERQLRDLREGVMRVRLVPVSEIFRRMPFVVRDLARETGKQVALETRGQDTEIDKFLVERMLDPVLHLVRNAVSHGIETPQERAAAGKPETATLTLSAASVGDLVVLEAADDGRGVDPQEVAAKARAAGLDVPEGTLGNDALLAILCAPGFSTRAAADRASGRGVGMAVVQTTVQELGGKLSLDTAPGQGTRFVIELPITLAITDAILARVGPQLFAIAQSAVREVMEVAPESVRAIENNELAPYRDGVLPLLRLSQLFGLPATPGRSLHVFVVGQGQSAVGLAVDRIIGQREIVVRTLADSLVKVDGVVGATDLGDGRAVLILDAQRLASHARGRMARSAV
jgi:two-component system chemotaxis sensor kinase CheA